MESGQITIYYVNNVTWIKDSGKYFANVSEYGERHLKEVGGFDNGNVERIIAKIRRFQITTASE